MLRSTPERPKSYLLRTFIPALCVNQDLQIHIYGHSQKPTFRTISLLVSLIYKGVHVCGSIYFVVKQSAFCFVNEKQQNFHLRTTLQFGPYLKSLWFWSSWWWSRVLSMPGCKTRTGKGEHPALGGLLPSTLEWRRYECQFKSCQSCAVRESSIWLLTVVEHKVPHFPIGFTGEVLLKACSNPQTNSLTRRSHFQGKT